MKVFSLILASLVSMYQQVAPLYQQKAAGLSFNGTF